MEEACESSAETRCVAFDRHRAGCDRRIFCCFKFRERRELKSRADDRGAAAFARCKALEPIESDMLTTVSLPERWVPEGAISSANDVVGLVAATDYFEGATLQEGMMIPRPGIQPGFREVAIVVDAETGVAGKVTPGDHVDIIATIEGDDDTPNRAELWASDVLVLDVGLPQDIEETDQAGNFSRGTGVPVTFALEAPDAVRLAYIESFSVKLRLALRGAGDTDGISDKESVFAGTSEAQSNDSGNGDD